ncbi:hypothetical protein EXIGLDRAFT_779701 [Exidia glandulosa HHB12029]|uniref:Hydrophobin n=1 Tax=Exidia glandulosa HHB12029 TaxID=1314781 RepID=A0A165BXY6_EXIGL|nr:hypothetical protein EXIGLDRAFT_779701 [Exidia glandulosa HHB12029]
MQIKFFAALVLAAAAPAAHALCCISGNPICNTLVSENPLENGIYNADVWVPEGAKNVLTNSTLNALSTSALEPLICCCMAANSISCRTKCGS